MEWIKVKINSERENLEKVQVFLTDIGINGCTVEDSTDFSEFLESKAFNWDYIDESLMDLLNVKSSVTAYLHDNKQGREQLDKILKIYDNVETEKVSDEDWENNWKKYFKPIEIGQRLVIKPSWEEYDNTENKKVVILDPGSSFGTGTHETTKLCLYEAEKLIEGDENVLDAGCGSGILGISALTLGAKKGVFFDIEQSSVDTVMKNAEVNGLEALSQAFLGNLIYDKQLYELLKQKGPFDVIFVNIVPDVINAMLPNLYNLAADNAYVICSGIIEEREQEVIKNMESCGLKDISSQRMNGWVVLTGRK
ncbi:MAG: 50S ribosomal protein L11 methyltransferase [Clostridia bacterium]|nr:50S ribosomal protein L11 methyltransferase [Clostridia bacterium]MDD3093758.1 50S ribosomal protein L11 methyltransferase [Clostridia bacterium]